MTNIKITRLESGEDSATVFWENADVTPSLLSLIFDNDGSCSNLSVDPKLSSATMPNLIKGHKYSVKLSALVGSEWFQSEQVYITI